MWWLNKALINHNDFDFVSQTLLDISEEFAMKLVKADERSDQNERELMK